MCFKGYVRGYKLLVQTSQDQFFCILYISIMKRPVCRSNLLWSGYGLLQSSYSLFPVIRPNFQTLLIAIGTSTDVLNTPCLACDVLAITGIPYMAILNHAQAPDLNRIIPEHTTKHLTQPNLTKICYCVGRKISLYLTINSNHYPSL